MNLLCRLFGHKAPSYGSHKGWGGYEYGDVMTIGEDGIDKTHALVYGRCARCGEKFNVVSIHVPHIEDTRDTVRIPRHYASNIQTAAATLENTDNFLDKREAEVLRKIVDLMCAPIKKN